MHRFFCVNYTKNMFSKFYIFLLCFACGSEYAQESYTIGKFIERSNKASITSLKPHNSDTVALKNGERSCNRSLSGQPGNKNLDDLFSNTSHNGKTNQIKRIRLKRHIVNLYDMLVCASDCDPWMYKGYGCYCGFLGSGYPVDGIDSCCREHDLCYSTNYCSTLMVYFTPYSWKCYNNKGYCSFNQNLWNFLEPCANTLCECDRILAKCLKQFPCPMSKPTCPYSSWSYFS